MLPRVLVATARAFPELDEDGPVLRRALSEAGLEALPAIWDDPAVRWEEADAVVIRSTWDYVPRRAEYLAWAERVNASVRLFNAADVIAWNTDKRYLADLERAGVDTVPTTLLGPGQELGPLPADQVVLKPTISAGAKDTARYRADDAETIRAHLARLHAAGRTAMLQPYLADIDRNGETGLIYLGGVFSHAIRKAPLLVHGAALPSGHFAPETITPRRPSDAERDLAERCLDALPWARRSLLYARVDIVPTREGPRLLELELTEPSLFLGHGDGAASRLAAVLRERLR